MAQAMKADPLPASAGGGRPPRLTAVGSPSEPERSAEDILGRTIHIVLGGTPYTLPVRSIKANREWKASLDGELAGMLTGIEAMESMTEVAEVMNTLVREIDDMVGRLIDLLVSYDTSGVLPSRDAIEEIEPDASADVLEACREVWRAANPLVVGALSAIATLEPPTSASSLPTNTPPPSTAGRRKKSRAD